MQGKYSTEDYICKYNLSDFFNFVLTNKLGWLMLKKKQGPEKVPWSSVRKRCPVAMKKRGYDLFPATPIQGGGVVSQGYEAIARKLREACEGREKTVITLECYPGVDQEELVEGLRALSPSLVLHSDDLFLPPEQMDTLLEKDMTDDPVFGIMTNRRLEDYLDWEKVEAAREEIRKQTQGIALVYGVGASLIHEGDFLVLGDITRWEIQLRYRKGMDNWRTAKQGMSNREKYKRGYFAEWRWADKVKDKLLPVLDFYLDLTTQGKPSLIDGDSYRRGLLQLSSQPFRLVPYFDPGVWGGDWMKEHFGLPENGSNYAWSFDGVPEENSLLMTFDGKTLQTPAQNLVLSQPSRLLGERVRARFGKEFPIRFDLLDTIHGENLSLQVHPLTEYIQEQFHMHYTQDESYYILDTQGEESCVWLGVKTGVDRDGMARDLEAAQRGEKPFPAEKYINRFPAKRHDHFLIPAGTVHCSGANTMVLEISATPYIFTFKLWDWGRLDLDGKPRPIHLDRGLANLQWNRDTQWVEKNLLSKNVPVYQDEHTKVERTGLHQLEFIDTFRISTEREYEVTRQDSVHVLNLVEGQEGTIVSPTGAFPPFSLHYAETCIIPQGAGKYRIVSPDHSLIRVMMATVRP